MTPGLFSPLRLRALELSNRIVVAPMCQYSARNGTANDWHLMHVGNLAISGFGLVIMEATAVEGSGRITPGCLGLYDDASEAALRRVVAFCSAHRGATAMGLQLGHAGRKGSADLPWRGGRPLRAAQGAWETVAPSAIAAREGAAIPRALDEAGMAAIRDAFVAATRRADRLGFDLIELHCGHGYLLHQFLSPLANQRTDEHGGSLANRLRYPLSVFAAMRAAWPASKPMGVRLSATDYMPGGWDCASAGVLVRELQALGCDFVDVSSGGISPAQKLKPAPDYQLAYVRELRQHTIMPLVAVGLIIDPQRAERIVRDGDADLVAIGRAALDDPRWAWQAARKLDVTLAYPAQYARCAPGAWPGRG